jgi:hypothetical protein
MPAAKKLTQTEQNLDDVMQKLASVEKRRLDLVKQREVLVTQLFELMKKLRVSTKAEYGLVAEIVRPEGKTVRFIDPVSFRNLVPDDETFFSCIKVLIEKAQEALAKKDFDKIVQITPPKPGEEKLEIRLVDAKPSKKGSHG